MSIWVDSNDVWDLLTIRRRAPRSARAASVEPHYQVLLAALDMGWRIEEPVYLRPSWGDKGLRVYYFILRQADSGEQKLLSVPEGQEVRRFVHDQGLYVRSTDERT